jgi:single-strand selective monofunctional uracil DNA glycosylase
MPVTQPRADLDRAAQLAQAARRLCRRIGRLKFSEPVICVYNPLTYARSPYEEYLRRFAVSRKRVLFLGMNPGPFGMVQTGIPFGEIAAVRDWLKIEAPVIQPLRQHPRRPITGFACTRSEVSGQRLWGLFAQRFGAPEIFFADHLVINYCPLAFVEASGRNRTPDKLPVAEKSALFAACDEHLRAVVKALQPEFLVGIGEFAWQRAQVLFPGAKPRLGRILHPSPASPAANRDWPAVATRQLCALGVWSR